MKTKIIAECKKQGIVLDTQIAYVLATAKWETNHTFKPVKEAYWLSEKWRKKNLRYYPYYGRGLVQITWKKNYEKFGKLLGIDLVDNPDLALKPDVAVFILVYGMMSGNSRRYVVSVFLLTSLIILLPQTHHRIYWNW